MQRFFIHGMLLSLISLSACSKDVAQDEDMLIINQYLDIPQNTYHYSTPHLPSFYSNQFIRIQDNSPSFNPVTDWGATLGRVLFYDKQLSIDESISCASCHQQALGFTDSLQFSRGVNGQTTHRHSMALANATFYMNGRFFWDERAATLEDQVLIPIQDPVEMAMDLDLLKERLVNTPYYPILFRKAFGDEEISNSKIAQALAQFVRSMVSYQSKFDQGRAQVSNIQDDFPNFTTQENLGKNIFVNNNQVNCFGCHNTEAFITDNPRNNGLTSSNTDVGISIHTNNSSDEGKFKAPSLKNVALRKHFMHDGSLSSLDEVIEFYNTGIRINPNLDPHLLNFNSGLPNKMNLSIAERNALKAFLETLTDEAFITDKKFSDPFF